MLMTHVYLIGPSERLPDIMLPSRICTAITAANGARSMTMSRFAAAHPPLNTFTVRAWLQLCRSGGVHASSVSCPHMPSPTKRMFPAMWRMYSTTKRTRSIRILQTFTPGYVKKQSATASTFTCSWPYPRPSRTPSTRTSSYRSYKEPRPTSRKTATRRSCSIATCLHERIDPESSSG